LKRVGGSENPDKGEQKDTLVLREVKRKNPQVWGGGVIGNDSFKKKNGKNYGITGGMGVEDPHTKKKRKGCTNVHPKKRDKFLIVYD